MHSDNTEHPPIGMTPRDIHNRERASYIIAAIKRHTRACIPIPEEWLEEWLDELKLLISRRQ